MAAAEDDVLRLDRQICFPLYAASHLITRLYRPLLDELDLTYPQYLVMLALWEESPRSVGELGRALYLDSGTLTPLLKRLEAKGFVERRRDPADERRVRVTLSRRGAQLRRRAVEVPKKLLCGVEGSEQSLTELREALHGLIAALEARED